MLGIIAGIVSVIFGIYIMLNVSSGLIVSSMKFGADFYTEMYSVTRYILLSVENAAELLQQLGGGLFIIAGMAEICYFAGKAFPINLKYANKKATNEQIQNEALNISKPDES